MRRPQWRIRTLLLLVMIAGLVLGIEEAWRHRSRVGELDDPADEGYVRRYLELSSSK